MSSDMLLFFEIGFLFTKEFDLDGLGSVYAAAGVKIKLSRETFAIVSSVLRSRRIAEDAKDFGNNAFWKPLPCELSIVLMDVGPRE